MTSPEQHPAPEPDPRDEADEQAPRDDITPAPDEESPADDALTDADVPDSPLALEPDETAIPESDRAPGVLRETPVGGKLPPEQDTTDSPVRDMPAPEDLAAQPEPATPSAPEQELAAPEADTAAESAPADEAPSAEPPAPDIRAEEPPAAESESAAEEAPPAEPPAPAPAEDVSAEEAVTPAAGTPRPQEPTAPPSEPEESPQAAGSIARPQDWDEDLSPELAAILFGGAGAAAATTEEAEPSAPEAPAPEQPEQATALETAPAADAPAPAVRPEAEVAARPRGPVMITTPDEARSRPITAGQFTAPPPDAPVKGKMRYVRIEEPLRGDKGHRIEQKWEYIGPDYPALEGLLVKRVESEELAYADGSWKLTFRRDYSEGRDERTVRIASDGEYAERTDRIRRREASSGKMVREREHVGLRYAAPVREEKGGFLSRLFGRGNGPQQEGPKRWRTASESEQRDARQDAGEALKMGLFERR